MPVPCFIFISVTYHIFHTKRCYYILVPTKWYTPKLIYPSCLPRQAGNTALHTHPGIFAETLILYHIFRPCRIPLGGGLFYIIKKSEMSIKQITACFMLKIVLLCRFIRQQFFQLVKRELSSICDLLYILKSADPKINGNFFCIFPCVFFH